MNGPIQRENLAFGASGIARQPFLASAGKMTRQLFGTAFGAVDVSIDRLMADTHGLAVRSKPARDLFRRPADLPQSDDMRTQIVQSGQFAAPCTPIGGKFLMTCSPKSPRFLVRSVQGLVLY